MPLHEYLCRACERLDEVYYPITQSPPRERACRCGARMRRLWHPPAAPRPWTPHYNQSVGAYVSSERQFREHLRRGSEQASQRLGMTVDYQPIPIAEVAHSDEGLQAGRKRRRDGGQEDPKRTYH